MKTTNEIDGNKLFDEILNELSDAEKAFNTKSFQISSQIISILESKNMLQKDFAISMGKSEAEISKWLSGVHNFTIKTIASIETVLGETIIITPKQISHNVHKAVEALISHIKDSNTIWPTLDLKTSVDTKPISPVAKVITMHNATFKNVEFVELKRNNVEPYSPTGT